MATPYNGKVMRMEMTDGAEAVGTFQKADGQTLMVTFTDVRFIKNAGGVPTANPYDVTPMANFHSSTLKGLTVVDEEDAQVQARPTPAQQTSEVWSGAPQAPARQQQPQPMQQQQQQETPLQPIQSQQNHIAATGGRDGPLQPAWGRRAAGGRGAAAPGRAAQPPARAAQPAPTAGASNQGAPDVPNSWARAVGGGGGGRGGGGRGGGGGGRGRGGGGRAHGRAWTPGVPQGDAGAAAVADDFDFAANNVNFEAHKASMLVEFGDEDAGRENDPVPPNQRKPEFEDDFFDMISHTLHEKTGLVAPAPRPGLKEQREMNMETFGAVAVPRSAHPRGVGGRAYGGRAYGANNNNGGGQGQGAYAQAGGQGGAGRRGGGGGGRVGYRGGGGRDGAGRWGRGGTRDEGGGRGGAGAWGRGGGGGGGGGAWGRGGGAGGRGQATVGGRGGGGRGAMRGRTAAAVV